MISNFSCKDTEALFRGRQVRRFIAIERIALRKLQQLHAASNLQFLRVPPGTGWKRYKGIVPDNTVFVLTTNGAFVFVGKTAMPIMSKLLIIIEEKI